MDFMIVVVYTNPPSIHPLVGMDRPGTDKEAAPQAGKGSGGGGNNMARLFTLLMRMRQACAHPFLVLGKVVYPSRGLALT